MFINTQRVILAPGRTLNVLDRFGENETLRLCYYDLTPSGKKHQCLYSHINSCLCKMGQFLSPVVVDEGVSGLRIRVGGHGGHAAVHIDPERNVVTEKNHRLDVNHVTQEKNVRLSWELPVLYLKSKNRKNCGKSRAAAD